MYFLCDDQTQKGWKKVYGVSCRSATFYLCDFLLWNVTPVDNVTVGHPFLKLIAAGVYFKFLNISEAVTRGIWSEF